MNPQCFVTYGFGLQTLARKTIQIINPPNWIDLGSGNGDVLQRIGFVPKNGYSVDVDLLPNEITGFMRVQGTNEGFLEKVGGMNPRIAPEETLVSLFDVIEHYPKSDGLALLDKIERISSVQIIFTPEGFLGQDGETHPQLAKKPYMWHKSGFTPEDFFKTGYSVIVLKNYHVKPPGYETNWNALFAFKSRLTEWPNDRILGLLKKYYAMWLLNPANFYLGLRSYMRNF